MGSSADANISQPFPLITRSALGSPGLPHHVDSKPGTPRQGSHLSVCLWLQSEEFTFTLFLSLPPRVNTSQVSSLSVVTSDRAYLIVHFYSGFCLSIRYALTTEGDHVKSDVHAHTRACEACQSPEALVHQLRVTNKSIKSTEYPSHRLQTCLHGCNGLKWLANYH